MKKVVPNGAVVKALREQLEKLSTQKEMANEIGVSVRKLRMIENVDRRAKGPPLAG